MEKNFTQKTLIVAVVILTGVILFLGLQEAFRLLLLVFAAILVSVYFRKLAELLAKHTRIKKRLSLLIVIVWTIALIGGFIRGAGAKISNQAKDFQWELPSYSQSITEELNKTPAGQWALYQGKQLVNQWSDNEQKITDTITSFFSSTFGALGDLYIVLILTIYFTATPMLYRKTFLAMFPQSKREKINKLMYNLYDTLGKRILGQIIAMIIVFIATGIGLTIMGVPFALLFALLAGLLNFIPNFWPLIALIPAALVALTVSPALAAGVIILFVVIQNIEGEFITPLIQQKMVNLPPAYIILFQVFMGIIAGGIGIILATPLLAIIIVLIQKLYIEPVADKA